MRSSDFAKKVYINPEVEDLDLHDIIDLKTYEHDFGDTNPEDLKFSELDDFWDLEDQNFIFKPTMTGSNAFVTQAIDKLDITTYLVWDMTVLINNRPIIDTTTPLESIAVPEGAPFGFVHNKFLFREPDVGDFI